ncbi:hypothetical protein NC99_30690 [Sunxiuqinia dokdonensis]|uniref:Uncharacterized protein n=1 Tax=Sunxiuqinia dokdonensis TaxID=1409788 RepID=A0A0L8V6L0_9BACT|nr:hypothetical protein NC99_30690 [Sunxiuqinia dokdonensis]
MEKMKSRPEGQNKYSMGSNDNQCGACWLGATNYQVIAPCLMACISTLPSARDFTPSGAIVV